MSDKKQLPPGWYKSLTSEEYHSGTAGVSSSPLKKSIEKTPAHLAYAQANPKPQTVNMQLGSVVHCLVLEPETFDAEYLVSDAGKPNEASF